MPRYYKGYRIGSIEKSVLKHLLNVSDVEFPINRDKSSNDPWSLIFRTARQKNEMPFVMKRLKDKGYIKLISKNYNLFPTLTNKGKEYLKHNFLTIGRFDQKINVGKIWNGKWHIVIFDIPESRRKTRNMLRFHLKKIGFIQIQASVWVYPFQCDEFISLIKTYFNLTSEVVYIIADSIEGEVSLKKKFKI